MVASSSPILGPSLDHFVSAVLSPPSHPPPSGRMNRATACVGVWGGGPGLCPQVWGHRRKALVAGSIQWTPGKRIPREAKCPVRILGVEGDLYWDRGRRWVCLQRGKPWPGQELMHQWRRGGCPSSPPQPCLPPSVAPGPPSSAPFTRSGTCPPRGAAAFLLLWVWLWSLQGHELVLARRPGPYRLQGLAEGCWADPSHLHPLVLLPGGTPRAFGHSAPLPFSLSACWPWYPTVALPC